MRIWSSISIAAFTLVASLALTSHADDRIGRASDRLAPMASGAELFTQNCLACHGPRGDGDGPAAAALNPRPRKLSDKQLMSKISDETIFNTVKKGGQAMGKSPIMPAFVQLDDASIRALVVHVRTLCNCSFTK